MSRITNRRALVEIAHHIAKTTQPSGQDYQQLIRAVTLVLSDDARAEVCIDVRVIDRVKPLEPFAFLDKL